VDLPDRPWRRRSLRSGSKDLRSFRTALEMSFPLSSVVVVWPASQIVFPPH
jgi:hypothetical protein